MYKVIDINEHQVHEFNEMDDMLDFIREEVSEIDQDVIEDDLEVTGISTVMHFTILDMDKKEKSEMFEFMEAYIDNMDKLK